MSFTVQPEALAAAAALTGQDAGGADEALHLVVAAGRLVSEGVSPADATLLTTINGYLHVEATSATVLAEATRLLATGLGAAGSRYATAESAVAGFLGGGP